jgi:LPS sulfotransferase NodH
MRRFAAAGRPVTPIEGPAGTIFINLIDLVSYLVCATPRSGSTLLCEGLKATGVAGRPEEYFEAVPVTGRLRAPADYLAGLDDPAARALLGDAPLPDPPPYSSLAGVDLPQHLARVRGWATTPNGVLGAKVMWGHVDDPAALFPDARYVWVRRQDTVRQAISLWRALQTQSWRDEGTGDGGTHAEYSFSALRHLVDLLAEHDAAWARFFADRPVLELTYEEIASDLPRALERTLAHVGIPRPGDWPPALPAMRRQADELSERWAEAYARDLTPSPT